MILADFYLGLEIIMKYNPSFSLKVELLTKEGYVEEIKGIKFICGDSNIPMRPTDVSKLYDLGFEWDTKSIYRIFPLTERSINGSKKS